MSAVPARSKAVIMSRMDEYRARTPRSAALFERASRSLPGGSTRTTVFSPPCAPYSASGEGTRMRDVDGNVYRDFLGNYTSLILGHAHPAVVAAVEEQVRRGAALAAPPALMGRRPGADAGGVERALRGGESELAAIIIEPVQGSGGIRAAEPDFLAFLRSYCDRVGALLIFDEIIAFRIGPNGAQGVFGVRPDLPTLDKIIGGGYALAAFGGRADVMGIFDARRSGALTHGGTFNGSPVAAAAGLATLREMTPDRYAWLDALGDRLRSRVADGLRAAGLGGRGGGGGSRFPG